MPAISECFGHGSPAGAALRGARRINLHPEPGSLCRFPKQDEDERAPGRVQDRLGEHAPRQALEMQVFDGNQPEPVDELSRDLVMKIAPLVPNMRMHPLQRLDRFAAPMLPRLRRATRRCARRSWACAVWK
jgi:hypothetical protein